MRKYQITLTRSIVLLFLLSGNVSAWATTISNVKSPAEKSHCQEMNAHAPMHHAAQQLKAAEQPHDCCQKSKPCNQLCCHHCLIGGIAGLAVFASMDIQFDYQRTDFSSLAVTLPDGHNHQQC